MARKNSPGCGCCDPPGTCLQQDTTLYTGVALSGLPSWSVTLGSATATVTDYNANYLWAACDTQFGCFTRPPANWRLGSFIAVDTHCCNLIWSNTSSTQNAYTGYDFSCKTGSPAFLGTGTVKSKLYWDSELLIALAIGTSSIGATIRQTLRVWIEHEVPADNNIVTTPNIARWFLTADMGYGTQGGRTGRIIGSAGSISQNSSGFLGNDRFSSTSANSGGLVTPISFSANSVFFPYSYFLQAVTGGAEVQHDSTTTLGATGTATLTII